VIDLATAAHLQARVPYADNPYTLELVSDDKDTAAHNAFIKQFENDAQVAVFHDVGHPAAGRNCFQSHIRRFPRSQEAMATLVSRTPAVVGQHYSFPAQQGTAPTIGIISLGGTYLTSDLTHYWQSVMGLSHYPTVSCVQVDRASSAANQTIRSNDGSDENTLDAEIAGGICPGAQIVFYFGPNTNQGFYDAIATAIHDTVHSPKVLSISWGAPEAVFSSQTMRAYDQLFATARQVICVASGDSGSSDGVRDGGLHVDFPASSPNVVACGGTSLQTSTETAWSWNQTYEWGTGGGVSGLFTQPSYQQGVVSLGNHRAVPDVALNADPISGWTIYFGGHLYTNQFGGTSCVAPAMAGLIALMNLTPNGSFAFNQLLYRARTTSSTSAAFVDIVTGSNDNIKRSGFYSCGGGYDCCTGLGAVNGGLLLTALHAGV
jgi:kumamolisin